MACATVHAEAIRTAVKHFERHRASAAAPNLAACLAEYRPGAKIHLRTIEIELRRKVGGRVADILYRIQGDLDDFIGWLRDRPLGDPLPPEVVGHDSLFGEETRGTLGGDHAAVSRAWLECLTLGVRCGRQHRYSTHAGSPRVRAAGQTLPHGVCM